MHTLRAPASFHCSPGSRVFSDFVSFANHNLVTTDLNRLRDVVT